MFEAIRKNYEFYKKNFYRGNDIYCPFCSGTYKAQKYRFTKELSEQCPVCSSTIEERTILLFLQAKTEILTAEPKILVVSEEGRVSDYFKNFPKADVKIYSETGDFTIKDNTLKDKYETAIYDLIVCNYILEKLPNYIPVLKEFERILKDDGIILLQANIDNSKDSTAEYPVASYSERLLIYGIPGNHRRFGKDYQSLVRSNGLNISKLKFTEGFDELPSLSFNKDEVFFIAYKSDQPMLFDNMDDLEAEMSEQKANTRKSYFSAFIYTVFFILPELFQKSAFSLWSNVNENEHNKGKIIYMIYVLIFGSVTYWGSFAFMKILQSCTYPGAFLFWLFIGFPVYLFFGGIGFFSMGGYFMTNDKAGIIKKAIVGFYVAFTLLISVALSF